MGDREDRGSTSSTTAIVVVVALLLLGLPCLAVVLIFGAGFFWIAHDVQIQQQPPIVQPAPPVEVNPEAAPVAPAPPPQVVPAEPQAPADDSK